MNRVVKPEAKILVEGAIFVASGVILEDVLPPIFLSQGVSASAAHARLAEFIQSEVIRFLFVKRGMLDIHVVEKH